MSGPLAVRDFRLLSLGQLTSTVGDYCYVIALPWLVLSGHGGPGLAPFLGGVVGAAVALGTAGVFNSFGNIVLITLIQRWAPPKLLGRVMSLITLAGFGTFPISVAVAGVLVRHLHPAPFFPVAGIVLGTVALAALTQPAMRQFGAAQAEPEPQAAVEVR